MNIYIKIFKSLDEFKADQSSTNWPLSHGVIACFIAHCEGEYARAKVKIVRSNSEYFKNIVPGGYIKIGTNNNSATSDNHQYAQGFNTLIEHNATHTIADTEIKTIFIGEITTPPIEGNQGIFSVELLAKPYDVEEQFKNIYDNVSKNPSFSKHIISSTNNLKTELLETTSSVYFIDPSNLKISLSHITNGQKTVDLTNSYDINSLKIFPFKRKIFRVNIVLECNWIHYEHTEKNLFNSINKTFSWDSLSAPDLLQKLQIIAKKNNKGNIHFLPANLKLSEKKSITKEVNGKYFKLTHYNIYGDYKILLSKYTKKSEKLYASLLSEDYDSTFFKHTKTLKLSVAPLFGGVYNEWEPHNLYEVGDIIRHLNYHLTCQFAHTSGSHFDDQEREKWNSINVTDQVFCQNTDHSFLDSKEGHIAIKNAFTRAASILDYTARNTIISVKISISTALQLSLDHSIVIEINKIRLRTKIAKIFLHIDGNKSFARIVLLAQFNTQNTECLKKVSEFSDKTIYNKISNINEFIIPDFSEKLPKFFSINDEEIVKHVEIYNDFDSQKKLLEQKFQSVHEFKSVMNRAKTDIKLVIKNMPRTHKIKFNINLGFFVYTSHTNNIKHTNCL